MQDIDAVALIFDHPGDAPNLTFNALQSPNCRIPFEFHGTLNYTPSGDILNLAMMMRKLLSLVLALTLGFASIACACPSAGDGSSTGEHHPQHQHHEAPAPAGADCDHQDCLDCVTSTVAKPPERVPALGGLARADFEDLAWVAIAPDYPYSVLWRAVPSSRPPEPRRLSLSSPVKRADLLLE